MDEDRLEFTDGFLLGVLVAVMACAAAVAILLGS